MFGISKVICTDKGPPSNSEDFARFADCIGFQHRKTMPRWPQANGIVELLMRTIKKVYQAAQVENKSGHQAIREFLRNRYSLFILEMNWKPTYDTTYVSVASDNLSIFYNLSYPISIPIKNPDVYAISVYSISKVSDGSLC